MPDKLEALIGDKRFLPATLLLVQSLKTILRTNLANLGAMADLKAYFATQKTVGSHLVSAQSLS